MKIEIKVPGPQEPGFLKRQRESLKYSAVFADMGKNPSAEALDSLVEYLLQFVAVPEDRDEALAALWDATEEDFMAIMAAISGTTGEVPKAKSETSTPGTLQE